MEQRLRVLAQWQQEQRPVRYHMKIQARKGFTDVIADSPPLMRLTTDGYVEVIWVMWGTSYRGYLAAATTVGEPDVTLAFPERPPDSRWCCGLL